MDEKHTEAASKLGWLVAIVALTVIAILVAVGLVLVFGFSGATADAKVLAACIALLGTLLAGLLTLVGVYTRHYMNQRSHQLKVQTEARLEMEAQRNTDLTRQEEERLRLESNRNNDLRWEAEQRLRQEAAVKALALLSTSSGGEVQSTQRTGVLFTLTNLGLADVAMHILGQLLHNQKIDAASASQVLDIALKSGNPIAIETASDILYAFCPKRGAETDGFLYPPSLNINWMPRLELYVRTNLLTSRLESLMARSRCDWSSEHMFAHLIFLYEVFKTEPNPHTRNGARAFLSLLITRLGKENDVAITPTGNVHFGKVLLETKMSPDEADKVTFTNEVLLKRLEDWLGESPPGPETK